MCSSEKIMSTHLLHGGHGARSWAILVSWFFVPLLQRVTVQWETCARQTTHMLSFWIVTFVHSACCDRKPQSGELITKDIYSLPVLEAEIEVWAGLGPPEASWGHKPEGCRWLECSSSQTFHSWKRRSAWRHEVTCSSLHRSHGRVRPDPGGLQGHLTPPWDGGSSLSSPPCPIPPKALPAVLLCSSHKATPGALEVRLPALVVVNDSLPWFLEVRWKCGSSSLGIRGLFTHHRTFARCLTLMDANLF